MKDSVKAILDKIVDNPDEVVVEEQLTEDGSVNILISVNQTDMGKVIGKGGKIIRSLRSLVRILAVKSNLRVFVNLNEQTD